MSWADCGTDSEGRPIGYAHEAMCDHPCCTERIDRGLAYACGGMHGESECSCERYFCGQHLKVYVDPGNGSTVTVCEACGDLLQKSPDWCLDEDEGVIKRKEGQDHA